METKDSKRFLTQRPRRQAEERRVSEDSVGRRMIKSCRYERPKRQKEQPHSPARAGLARGTHMPRYWRSFWSAPVFSCLFWRFPSDIKPKAAEGTAALHDATARLRAINPKGWC